MIHLRDRGPGRREAWHGRLAAALLALAAGAPAHADFLDGHRVTFGAFGTLAADYSFAHGLEYRKSAGAQDDTDPHHLEFATDSVIGAQVNAAWNDQLEAVVQLVSKDDAQHRWRPRLTRAFLRYTPDEWLMLRGGRVGYELFPHADSVDVGYSYLGVRRPVEMFGQFPYLDFDGADLTLIQPLGPGVARAKVYAGVISGAFVQEGLSTSLAGSRLWGGQVQYLAGPWTGQLGLGWVQISHNPPMDALVQALGQTGDPQAQQLAFALEHRRIGIVSTALTFDQKPWEGRLYLARSYAISPANGPLSMGNATLGYSVGRFTPFAVLSRARTSAKPSTGLPDTPQTAPLNAAVQTLELGTNQSTAALGLRYDFAPKMDLKFQVDRVWEQGSVFVVDSNTPPGPRGALTLFSVAFDFVY